MILGCGESAAVAEQSTLEEYIQSNRISATKSGFLYYSIDTSNQSIDSLQIFPSSSNIVSTHLKGSLTDGQVFGDTKNDTGVPLTLGLSTNLIEGLKQGLKLIPKSSSGTLYIPPSLAYGDFGDMARGIPSDAIIIYDIEMLNIYANETAYNDSLIQNYLREQQVVPDTITSSIRVFIESEGGSLHPDDDSFVIISYKISTLEGDLLVDVSESMPVTIDLDDNEISALGDALPIFGTGGSGTLLIPSQEAYGSKGSDTIPGYTPLVFDFQLIDVID